MNLQFFAEKENNIKALMEERAEKVSELELLYATLEGEQRAITDEEEQKVNELNDEIEKIDKTIGILEQLREKFTKGKDDTEDTSESGAAGEGEQRAQREREARERKEFEGYLRGALTGELRAGDNMTHGDNGDIIPQTIADKIIKKVYDISPVLERATKYNVKGKMTIPYYEETEDGKDITMGYHDEFKELESTAGKFKSIELGGFLAGVLTLISKSLINNSKFDVVSFVIDRMAYNISRWIEKELLLGTDEKIQGLRNIKKVVNAAGDSSVKSDELIDLQDSVKDEFQQNAIWIMSTKTRTSIRKLKDANGRYLLQDDINSPFGKLLLGKPVFTSDNMPEMAAGNAAIYYGDLSGLAVKIAEELEIQVLREKYATQHAIGIVGWMELDSKVEDEQKLAVLKMKENAMVSGK